VEAEIKSAVSAALRQELSLGLLLMALLSVMSAAIGAYFGSFLKQRALNAANRHDFELLLSNMKRQTQEVESVKGQIQLESQRALELIRSEMGEQRENLALKRDRINTSFGTALNALAEVELLVRVVRLRGFDSSKWLDSTSNLYRASSAIETNLGLLILLGAVPEGSTVEMETSNVRWEYDRILGYLHYKEPSFRQEYPTSPEFSSEVFNEIYSDLTRTMHKLKSAVMQCLDMVIAKGY
jgi:hypothetical protein